MRPYRSDRFMSGHKAAGVTVKYLLIFTVTLALFVLALFGAACIPREAVRKQMERSGDYLCRKPVFFDLKKGVDSTKVDRYADSILLSITWHLDEKHPLMSAMRTAYYYTDDHNENYNFRDSVREGLEANRQYLRYWHGSAAYLRVMHLFWSVEEIYLFHKILLWSLAAVLSFVLLKAKLFAEAAGIAAALAAVSFHVVPYSLEYTWTFLLMLPASVLITCLSLKGKRQLIFTVFLIVGMLTAYMDFLTTELLTLLMPLLLAICVQRRQKGGRPALSALKVSVLWGAGYAGAWGMKWVLASVILRENVMPYISEHIKERIGGEAGRSFFGYLAEALARNLKCLFPSGYVTAAAVMAAAAPAVTVCVCVILACRKKLVLSRMREWKRFAGLCAVIAVIPYLRYICLGNHSYIHYFFTYRAQAVTVFAVCLCFLSLYKKRDT